MPNHVTTIVTGAPDVLRTLIRTLTAQEQFEAHQEELKEWPRMQAKSLSDFEDKDIIDFELIVPSPPNKEKGGCGMGSVGGIHPDTGEVCWYEWNIANWGTKWGAYSAVTDELESGKLTWETAWSHAEPVLRKLSEMHPDETIIVQYADEDTGSNCGEYVLLAGDVTQETEMTQDEANDFASMINYGKPYAEVQAEWAAEEAEYASEEPVAAPLALLPKDDSE